MAGAQGSPLCLHQPTASNAPEAGECGAAAEPLSEDAENTHTHTHAHAHSLPPTHRFSPAHTFLHTHALADAHPPPHTNTMTAHLTLKPSVMLTHLSHTHTRAHRHLTPSHTHLRTDTSALPLPPLPVTITNTFTTQPLTDALLLHFHSRTLALPRALLRSHAHTRSHTYTHTRGPWACAGGAHLHVLQSQVFPAASPVSREQRPPPRHQAEEAQHGPHGGIDAEADVVAAR